MKTAEQARNELRVQLDRRGETLKSWAKTHGFDEQNVHDVLRKKSKGRYGQAHAIAVTLGIKAGEAVDEAASKSPRGMPRAAC